MPEQRQAAETCEHYWAWVSPAGSRKSARICVWCHQPDAGWLNHVIEVDRGHGAGCVNCEFADVNQSPATPPADSNEQGA